MQAAEHPFHALAFVENLPLKDADQNRAPRVEGSDLGDRDRALELKLRSVQGSLELVLHVARDRRLETIVVLLILSEIILAVGIIH